MSFAKFWIGLALLLCLAGNSEASTLLASMSETNSWGVNQPPLFSSANFSFAVFNDPDDKNAWQLGPITTADLGHTFSLTSATAANYPGLDFDRLNHDLTDGTGANIIWIGFGPPTGPVTGFGGLFMNQIFQGFHAPSFNGQAYVPSLNGIDFAGYQFDRFDLTVTSLGFHQDGAFYYIDASFGVQMFGTVPEPASASLFVIGALVALGGLKVQHRRKSS
jgi:hypothetical protein